MLKTKHSHNYGCELDDMNYQVNFYSQQKCIIMFCTFLLIGSSIFDYQLRLFNISIEVWPIETSN